MAPREQLQALLEETLGSENVYFQPPANMTMQYPCIVYQRDLADTKFADNNPYHVMKRYQVTVISRDPDLDVPDKIAALPRALFNRFFVADNLNHDVYTLYY